MISKRLLNPLVILAMLVGALSSTVTAREPEQPAVVATSNFERPAEDTPTLFGSSNQTAYANQDAPAPNNLLQYAESNVTHDPNVPIASGTIDDVTLLYQAPNQVDGYFSDASCDVCGSSPQVIAENFSLSSTETINQIILWTAYYPTDVPIDPDVITVIFHDDAAGLPGAAISTESPVPYSRVQTGRIIFGVHEWMHTLTLATPVTLGPGTYWVEIYNDTGFGTDDFAWETGDLDPVHGIPGGAFATTAPGSNWSAQPLDFSIQLISTDVGWIKLVDGEEWTPGIGVTVQTSDTIEIVDVVNTFRGFTLFEDWYTPTLELIGHEVSFGEVLTNPIEGSMRWLVPPGPPEVVTLTKWFYVQPCTWTETFIGEVLEPESSLPEPRFITVTKLLPALWIDATYDPEVLAGELAGFTLDYGNTGGFENDVLVANAFPSVAPFVSSVPTPTYVAPDGSWVEWAVGDLAMDDVGSIDVVIAVTDTLVTSDTFPVFDWIIDHVGQPADMVTLTFHVTCVELTGVTIWGDTSGEPGTYTFTTIYDPPDATPPIDYLWDDGGTDYFSVRSLGVGTHTLIVTASNCLDAQVFDSHEIVITPACEPVNISDVSETIDGCVVDFGPTYIGDPPITWAWEFQRGNPPTSTNESPTGIDFVVDGTYAYTVTAANCVSDTDTFYGDVTVSCAVPPTYGVELTPGTGSDIGEPGDNLVYTLTVENTGDVTDTFDLSFSDLDGWTAGVTPTQVELAASDTAQVFVSVDIPGDANHGDYDVATVTAISQGDSLVSDSSTLTTTAIVVSECVAVDITDVTETVDGCLVDFGPTYTGDAPITWAWEFQGGTPSTSTAENPAGIDFAVDGTYAYTVTANNCITGTDTFYGDVTVSCGPCTEVAAVELTQDTQPARVNQPVEFSVNLNDGADPDYSYSYTVDDGTPEGPYTASSEPFSFTYTFLATGTHTVESAVWNCAGTAGDAVTDTVDVVVYAEGECVDVSITGLESNSPVEQGTAMYFSATVTGDLPITYTWDFGGAGTQGGSDANPTFTYDFTGTYTVTLVVANACPSTNTETLSVQVTEPGVPSYDVYLPVVVKN